MSIQEWIAGAYQQLTGLRPEKLPEMIAGVDAFRDVMQENRRRLEVCTSLMVEALRYTGDAKVRERILRSKVSLLRRTAQEGAAVDEHGRALDDVEALKCLVAALRAQRDNLRSAAQDIRTAARLVVDQMNEPNPGVREIRERVGFSEEPRAESPAPEEWTSEELDRAQGRQMPLSDAQIRELLYGKA